MNKQTTTELIIVRHGKTAWNLEGRLQGQQDTDLHPIGVRQAEALAERLQDEPLAAIYSSDLKRAAQTAECVAQRKRQPIILRQGLRERNFGVFEGKTRTELETEFPEAWAKFHRYDPDYAMPDGMSLREFYANGIGCLEEIARQHPGERILIVTHGGLLGGLLRLTLGIPYSTPSRYQGANTAINIFAFEHDAWTLTTWGDASHLRDIE